MKKNQSGLSATEVLMAFVFIGLIVSVGWFVYSKRTEKNAVEPALTPLCTSNDGQQYDGAVYGDYSSDSDAQEDPGELNWGISVYCNGTVLFHDDTVHAINGEDIKARATNQQINELVEQANSLLGEPENDKCFIGRVDGLIEDYYGKTGERFEIGVILNKDESNVWVSCRDNNALPSKERVEFLKKLSDLVPGFPYKERLDILSKYDS